MKKIISMVLSFILILGCSTTAFAAETHNYDTENLPHDGADYFETEIKADEENEERISDFVTVYGYQYTKASVYKGYKRDKIEMRGDRAEISDFPLYLNTVAGGLDRRDQTIGGFSFVVKIYALPVVEIIGQLLYLLGRYGFNAQFGDCL